MAWILEGPSSPSLLAGPGWASGAAPLLLARRTPGCASPGDDRRPSGARGPERGPPAADLAEHGLHLVLIEQLMGAEAADRARARRRERHRGRGLGVRRL